MSGLDKISYLQGVIDTLKDIIQNNTSIKISSDMLELVDKGERIEKIDNQEEENIVDNIDTAKNYIVLLERMRQNRSQYLSRMEINEYTDFLEKSISETIDKLKARGLDDKKIDTLIRTKFLRTIDIKLLLKYKYDNISLTSEDITFLRDSSRARYNYSSYKVFNKNKFIDSFLNYTIAIFDISEGISNIVTNLYC